MRPLIPRFVYDYQANCTGRYAEDGLTEEGFQWTLERHGPWPFEEYFYIIRVGDLDGDGAYEFLLTRGAMGQIAFDQEGMGSFCGRYGFCTRSIVNKEHYDQQDKFPQAVDEVDHLSPPMLQ